MVTHLAAKPEDTSADLVLYGGTVYTCDSEFLKVDAIAIRDSRIVFVGKDDEIRSVVGPETRVIDLEGRCVTPGFCDSHLHFVGLGQSLQMLDLSTAKSWRDIETQVAAAAEKLPKGTWIEGRGWHQAKWEETPDRAVDGYPSHYQLSVLVPDHPVLLTHASGHACFANKAAMDMAGVTRATRAPEGGEILKDSEGDPIGVFSRKFSEPDSPSQVA